jgi:hypothetical protein
MVLKPRKRFGRALLVAFSFALVALCGGGCGDGVLQLRRLSTSTGGGPSTGGGNGQSGGNAAASGGRALLSGGSSSVGGATGGAPSSSGGNDNLAGAGSGASLCPGPYCDPCEMEPSCKLPTPTCEDWLELCATCRTQDDCASGEACDPFLFRCTPRCGHPAKCPASRPHCMEFFDICNECDTYFPCRRGYQCIWGQCVACIDIPSCRETLPDP